MSHSVVCVSWELVLCEALRIKYVNFGGDVSDSESFTVRGKSHMTDSVLVLTVQVSHFMRAAADVNPRDLTVFRSAHDACGVFRELE